MKANLRMYRNLSENDPHRRTAKEKQLLFAMIRLLEKVRLQDACVGENIFLTNRSLRMLRNFPICFPPLLDGENVFFKVSWPSPDHSGLQLWFLAEMTFFREGLLLTFHFHHKLTSERGTSDQILWWQVESAYEWTLQDDYSKKQYVEGVLPFHEAVELLHPDGACEVSVNAYTPWSRMRDDGEELAPDKSEEYLSTFVDLRTARKRQIYRLPAPKNCSVCQTQLKKETFVVDCILRHLLVRVDLCPSCFAWYGGNIRYGEGQLYMKQPRGKWLCVAGFPPDR